MNATDEVIVVQPTASGSALNSSRDPCRQTEILANVREIIPDPALNVELPIVHVTIMRSNILKMLISEFKNSALLHSQVEFFLISDTGDIEEGRGTGLTREILCLFWREFYTALSVGGTEKVPSIRHDYQRSEWASIARIIVFGYKEVGQFPLNISRVFFASCLFGEEVIPDSCLIDSFKLYVSRDEQEVLEKCFDAEFNPEDEDLLDFLSAYKCYRVPKRDTIQVTVKELAHQELIQKPRYVANVWLLELNTLTSEREFRDLESLITMYEAKKPSAKKVIKLLDVIITKEDERECFEYLKRYIKSLDDTALGALLQFLTGSNIITVQKYLFLSPLWKEWPVDPLHIHVGPYWKCLVPIKATTSCPRNSPA